MLSTLLSVGVLLVAAGQDTREMAGSLNGTWQVQRTSGAELAELGDEWQDVQVPSHLSQAAPPYAWYRRTFALPPSRLGPHVFLSFGGVKFASEVYVNRHHVGGHYGGWEPFEMEITDACRFSTPNELMVRVEDVRGVIDGEVEYGPGRDMVESVSGRVMAPVGSQTSLFGIWQDVGLVFRNDVCIEDVTIVTSVRKKRIEVKYILRNLGKAPCSPTLRAAVQDGDEEALHLGEELVTVPAGGMAEHTLRKAWPNAKLWAPDSPHLYYLESALHVGPRLVDADSTRFGFREFWTDGIHFVLNGTRVKFLATAGHPPSRGELLDDQRIRERYQALRSANCMAVRLHANIWPENWYDVADEIGLPIIQESAIWCFARNYALEREEFWENARDHWRAVIRRDKNHPSVVMYSIENEILHVGGDRVAETEKNLADLGRFVKSLDPTRPIMYDGDEDADGAADVVNLHYPHEFPTNTLYPNTCYWINEKTRVSGWPRREWEWDRKKPLYIGEFLWVPARSAHGFSVLLGDDAYTDFARSLHRCKAMAWEMQVEAYRSAEVSGMCPWTLWESGSFPHEQYRAVRRAYEPNAAIVREYDRRFYAGEKVKRTVFLYNDTLKSADLTLEWSLGGQRQGRRSFSLEPAERVETSIEFTTPAVREMTGREFELVVKNGARTVYQSAKDYWIFPRRAPRFRLADGTRLAVYDGKGQAADLLRRGGVEPIELDDLTRLSSAEARLLVIEPHVLDELVGKDRMPVVGGGPHQVLSEFVNSGGAVLVLEQERFPADMLPVSLTDRAATMAFKRARAGGLLDGLPEDAFKFWRGDNVVARRTLGKPREGGFRVFVDAGSSQGLDAALLLEVAQGEGGYVLSQLLMAEKLGLEPLAQIMFERLVNYAATPRAPGRSVGLVRGKRLLDEDLKAIGAEFDDLTGRLQKADLSQYEVLVLDGSSGEVGPCRRALHRVDADAMAALSDTVPGDLTVRPSFHVPVLIRHRDDEVTDGLTNEDLYWIFETSGDWRRRHPLYSGVLAGEITRRPPSLEQCTIVEAEAMEATAGDPLVREDSVYMARNGALETRLVLPKAGGYFFGVVGEGTHCDGVFPDVAVYLDDRLVGHLNVSDAKPGVFSIQGEAEAGPHHLRLAFTNDAWAPEKGEDRNLLLDSFFYAESQPGPEKALLRPAGLVKIEDGEGFWLIDQVTWDGRTRSSDNAARYLSGLLNNLGVSFGPGRRGTAISGARMEPVEIDHFRREGDTAYMGSRGQVTIDVKFLRGGRYNFDVTARGTPAAGEYPIVQLLLDGEPVGDRQIRQGGWESLIFTARVNEGVHRVGLAFTNDLWDPEKNEDRNLWVRRVVISQ